MNSNMTQRRCGQFALCLVVMCAVPTAYADDFIAHVEIRNPTTNASVLEDGLKVNVSHVDVDWKTHWTLGGTRYYSVHWRYSVLGGYRTYYTGIPNNEVQLDERSASAWVTKARGELEAGLQKQTRQNGIHIVLVDQDHLAERLDDRDLDVTDVVESSPSRRRTKMLSPDLKIYADVSIDVKLETGDRTTVSGVFSSYRFFGWRHHTYIRMSRRQSIRRIITFAAHFTAEDARTGEIWASYAPSWQPVDTENPSRYFGSDKHPIDFAQSDDQLIMAFLDREIPNFVRKLTPAPQSVVVHVKASHDADCRRGVQQLNYHDYRGALESFRAAIEDDDDDGRAHFGAGVSAELIGTFDVAAVHYEQAVRYADRSSLAMCREALVRVRGR